MTITNLITLSAYCWCAPCCGKQGQPTSAGVNPKVGITIAAPRNIPLGTRVYVEGVGERTVQDRTARKYNGRWDLFVGTHKEAKKHGIKKVKIVYEIKDGLYRR